jgi:hypothetical protein
VVFQEGGKQQHPSIPQQDLLRSILFPLLDQRIKPVDVAEVMGHRSVAMTLAFYAHAIPRDMGYVADKLTAARQRH